MSEHFNTGETAEELKSRYNPEGSVRRAVQNRLMDMLLYLDSVCKEIGVPYRLEGGNVLGAVRHGGFIPWDDDMDVAIEKKHYKKLCDYLRHHPHPQYVFQSYQTDKGFMRFWCTIRDTKSEYVHRTPDKMNDGFTYRGLQIDLFCMYPSLLPWLHRIAYLIYRYTVSRMVGHSYHLAKISFYIQRYFVHPIFYAFSSVFGKKDVYMHAYGTPFRFRFPRETVLPYKDIIFENHRFPGPCDPDNYCICHYGSNYRDLPEEDQRNHHDVDYILND